MEDFKNVFPAWGFLGSHIGIFSVIISLNISLPHFLFPELQLHTLDHLILFHGLLRLFKKNLFSPPDLKVGWYLLICCLLHELFLCCPLCYFLSPSSLFHSRSLLSTLRSYLASHFHPLNLMSGSSALWHCWTLLGPHLPVLWKKARANAGLTSSVSLISRIKIPCFLSMAWNPLPNVFLTSLIVVFRWEASLVSLSVSCLGVEGLLCVLWFLIRSLTCRPVYQSYTTSTFTGCLLPLPGPRRWHYLLQNKFKLIFFQRLFLTRFK